MNNDMQNRDIELPIVELDESPPNQTHQALGMQELTPERTAWKKWNKNFGFLKFIISIMFFMYVAEYFLGDKTNVLKEPYFEVLKTLLFTVGGYVFGRSKEE